MEPIVGYSRAVRIGNHVWVCRARPLPARTARAGDAYIRRLILSNICSALERLARASRTRMYVVNIARDWEGVGRAHGEVRDIRPRPRWSSEQCRSEMSSDRGRRRDHVGAVITTSASDQPVVSKCIARTTAWSAQLVGGSIPSSSRNSRTPFNARGDSPPACRPADPTGAGWRFTSRAQFLDVVVAQIVTDVVTRNRERKANTCRDPPAQRHVQARVGRNRWRRSAVIVAEQVRCGPRLADRCTRCPR
jgi:hypothetical protein